MNTHVFRWQVDHEIIGLRVNGRKRRDNRNRKRIEYHPISLADETDGPQGVDSNRWASGGNLPFAALVAWRA